MRELSIGSWYDFPLGPCASRECFAGRQQVIQVPQIRLRHTIIGSPDLLARGHRTGVNWYRFMRWIGLLVGLKNRSNPSRLRTYLLPEIGHSGKFLIA